MPQKSVPGMGWQVPSNIATINLDTAPNHTGLFSHPGSNSKSPDLPVLNKASSAFLLILVHMSHYTLFSVDLCQSHCPGPKLSLWEATYSATSQKRLLSFGVGKMYGF